MPTHHWRHYLPIAAVALLAAMAVVLSYGFKDVPPMLVRGFQPAAFPRFVAVTVLILCVVECVRVARHGDFVPGRLPRAFHLSLVALAAFGAVVAVGDFLLALIVGTMGLSFMWGERRPLTLALVGILAPVLVVVLFDQVFGVRFPRGLLMNLYYG